MKKKQWMPLLLAGALLLLSACGSAEPEPVPEPVEPEEIIVEVDEFEEPEAVGPDMLEMTLEEAEALLVEGEDGTVPIETVEQMVALSVLVHSGDTSHYEKTYVVQSEINLTEIAFQPIGGGDDVDNLPMFGGTFDGGNLLMYGPVVTKASAHAYGNGLFGAVAPGGSVKNLHLTAGEVTGNHMTGGFVGYNAGEVENASFRGTVTSNASDVGGFCGTVADGGALSGCFSNTDTFGNTRTGGFLGSTQQGASVRNCYGLGAVTSVDSPLTDSPANLGGFIGRQVQATVQNCYSNTEVYTQVATQITGAFIGYNDGEVTGCYYNESATENWDAVDANLDDVALGVTGCTVEELLDEETYEGWDFSGIWGIEEGTNRGLPYLRAAWED